MRSPQNAQPGVGERVLHQLADVVVVHHAAGFTDPACAPCCELLELLPQLLRALCVERVDPVLGWYKHRRIRMEFQVAAV